MQAPMRLLRLARYAGAPVTLTRLEAQRVADHHRPATLRVLVNTSCSGCPGLGSVLQ